MATHSSIFAWKIPWMEEPGGSPDGVAKSQTRLSTAHTHTHTHTPHVYYRNFVKFKIFLCGNECKLIKPLWRTVWQFLKNLGIKLPCLHAQLLGRIWLFETPWTIAHQSPLFMKLSRQDYWSGLPLPTLGDLPHPWIKPTSPALAGGFFTISTPGKPKTIIWPSNPTIGHIPWENHRSKRHMYPNVHCSTIYSSQDMKPT